MKKILASLLAVVFCISMMGTVMAAEMNFADVSTTDWFYNDVKTAVESGLVNGKTPTTYAPDDNLTYAEAIKLAACMNQLYTEGSVSLSNGDPWYKSYVDYCSAKGIINKEYTYTDNAPRAGYMEIFANALPSEGLKAINNIPDDSIPDVPYVSSYAPGIYKLYRAGILQGVDDAHNCNPLANIKRSEVAAILTRMMNESARIKFSIGGGSQGGGSQNDSKSDSDDDTAPETKPLSISVQPDDRTVKLGETAEAFVEVKDGKKPYEYQWQIEIVLGGNSGWADIDSPNFKGFDTDTLLATISSAGVKNVRCVIIDAKGDKVVSDVASLEFTAEETALEVKTVSNDVTTETNESVSLTVSAQGGKAPYTYRWQIKNELGQWSDISDNPFFVGSKEASLEVSLSEKTVEYFRCVIEDANGKSVISEEITLTVNEAYTGPLTIGTQPVSVQDVVIGDKVNFSVGVFGGVKPYTYQWQQKLSSGSDFKNLTASSTGTMASEGFDTDILTVKVTGVGSDRYQYRCIITDAKGNTLTSDAVCYKVAQAEADKPFAIVTQPASITVEVGQNASLSVAVEGGKAPYTYQWQSKLGKNYLGLVNDEAISGANTETLLYTKDTEGTEDFRCIITDANGTKLTSNTVTIIFEPASLTIADVKLSVEGIDVASAGVILWGKLESGAIKEGDVLYLNDSSNFYAANVKVVKLEVDRKLVTSTNAVNAGTKTVGILTDLDSSKWKDAVVSGYVISSIRGIVTTGVDSGSSDFKYVEFK